jgi:hypothetical protein
LPFREQRHLHHRFSLGAELAGTLTVTDSTTSDAILLPSIPFVPLVTMPAAGQTNVPAIAIL